MADHLESGRSAERLGKRFLLNQGMRHLASNYSCRYGELDLVMGDGEVLVVVEVRYRRHTDFMDPIETITRKKRQRITRATSHFLQHNSNYRHHPVRFDVLTISGQLASSEIKWIPGAFTLDED